MLYWLCEALYNASALSFTYFLWLLADFLQSVLSVWGGSWGGTRDKSISVWNITVGADKIVLRTIPVELPAELHAISNHTWKPHYGSLVQSEKVRIGVAPLYYSTERYVQKEIKSIFHINSDTCWFNITV